MAMNIYVHKQPTVGLLVKLCKLALLIISVFKVRDQQLCGSDRWPSLRDQYVLSIDDWP